MINWTVSPDIFTIGSHEVRWYGLLFALGLLILGPMIIERIWQREKLPEKWLTSIYMYVVIGTIVGARLGHVLFYDPVSYLQNPVKIFYVWEGGLASHGGTIGVILAMWLYSRRITHKGILWGLDRLAVTVGLVAAMIRLGNLMNSEIFGRATDLPWGFRFLRSSTYWTDIVGGADYSHSFRQLPEAFIDSLPASHPTSIYEAFCYLIVFFVCLYLYYRRDAAIRYNGLIVGVFLSGIFISRFFIECVKLVQEPWEISMVDAIGLNQGQLLSLPFIVAGLWLILRAIVRKRRADASEPNLTA